MSEKLLVGVPQLNSWIVGYSETMVWSGLMFRADRAYRSFRKRF
jgi:hypothetical protein